jgi:hypothetical protein
LALNTRVRELSEALVAKGRTPYDSSGSILLEQLQEIRNFLAFYLPTTQHQLQGYDAVVGHIKNQLSETGVRCLATLKSLESYVTDDKLSGAFSPELVVSTSNASHLLPPSSSHDDERIASSSTVSPSILVLFQDH